MRDTDERTELILQRVRMLRRRRARQGSEALAAICCVLCVCLAGLFQVQTDGGGSAHVPELYGSALLYSGAGGYVLVGVMAFAAGVVVTVLCIRNQEKNREEKTIQKKKSAELYNMERK